MAPKTPKPVKPAKPAKATNAGLLKILTWFKTAPGGCQRPAPEYSTLSVFAYKKTIDEDGKTHFHRAPWSRSREFITECLRKHLHGDWGTVDITDKRANDFAVDNEERILSAYEHDGKKTVGNYRG